MNNFIYVFVVCIILIGVIIGIASMFSNHDGNDSPYLDDKGRHSYYDRSLIEKDEFHRHNPDIPYSEIRSFKRLFKNLRFLRFKK